jgi:hypothetical protein
MLLVGINTVNEQEIKVTLKLFTSAILFGEEKQSWVNSENILVSSTRLLIILIEHLIMERIV